MKTLALMTIVQFIYSFSWGFIPPVEMVIEKAVSQNSKQTILFEQDVHFADGLRDAIVREAWLMDGDRKLKMVAQGLGEYKERIKIVAVYRDGQRTTLVGKNKVTEAVGRDFFERYFGLRSTEALNQVLTDFNIQPQVRLSRASGAIAFAVGQPSEEKEIRPHLWIKQDTFDLIKIRTPTGAEMSFEDFTQPTAASWTYPKHKKIDWNGKTVTIKVKTIAARPNTDPKTFIPQLIESPSELTFTERDSLSLMIEEFYKRFR